MNNIKLDPCRLCGGEAIIAEWASTVDEDKVICPNCGKEHPLVYNIMFGARCYGKSLQRLVDELGCCDMKCLLELADKYELR